MPAPHRLPPKKDVALALLEQSMVFVHLDPRDESVKVPPWFKKQPQLVLQLGLNMPVPIPDLDVNEEGISCTLSFNRSPHYCWIPWNSVYALVGDNGRGMVWPDDVPREVAAQTAQQQPKAKPAPKLHAVSDEPKPEPEKPAKKKRAKKAKAASATSAGKQPKVAARPSRRNAEAPLSPEPAEATQAHAGAPADTKRKRELPPYLRVIK